MGLFGPSKNEIWKSLSEEMQATYDDGNFWKDSRIEVRHGNWALTLDTFTQSYGNSMVTYTRMRTPFVNPSAFRFRIYKEGFFSSIGKALGGQDIEVGDPDFDGSFIIKGTDEERVRLLFQNQRIRSLILALPHVSMEIRAHEGVMGPAFADDEDELYFMVPGVLKDMEQLKILFDLFSEVLDTMVKSGMASDVPPTVTL